MNKRTMALVAITIITASVLSAPYSTEARNPSETRSTLSERHRSATEMRVSASDRHKNRDSINIRPIQRRLSEVRIISQPSNNLPSDDNTPTNDSENIPVGESTTTVPAVEVDDTVAENTESTQPEVVVEVTEPEPEPEIITEEEESDTAPADEFMAVLSDEIHRLTNIERKQAGVPALQYDNALAAIATGHSEDMAENDYFSHTEEDGCTLTCRIDEAGYKASYWGENIAWRSSTVLPEAEELAALFVDMWMNSEGHRINMLSSNYTHEGIGLARVGNKVYATANFSKPL